MSTSAKNTHLYEPAGDGRIPATTFAYFETRNRFRFYDLIMQAFADSGISQATLSRRMGLGPDQINRWFKSPGNWTLDTGSNLLFAICGGEPNYTIAYPLRDGARNDTQPDW